MARPREFDEDSAVDTALDTFWELGYRGTTVDDLDKAIGIGRSSFYAAFGDKRTLFLRALDRYCGSSGQELLAALEVAEGLQAALGAALNSILAADLEGRPGLGCFMVNSVAELARTDPDVRRRAQVTFDAIETRLELAIRAAQARREIRTSLDAKSAASSLMVFMQGLRLVAQASVPASTLRSAVVGALSVLD